MDLVINDFVHSCCGETPCSCPDKMPTPAGLIDNSIDENDILLLPHDAIRNAHKVVCSQCNGNGSIADPTVVPDTYDYGFAPRQIKCALYEGRGFTI